MSACSSSYRICWRRESAIDAETFASQKCAIFLILPEEDSTKNFMAGLLIQNLSRELFAIADENGGKLKNRVVFYCDELGTMPPFDILPEKSARKVAYADKKSLTSRIREKYPQMDRSRSQQTAQPEKDMTDGEYTKATYNTSGGDGE